MSIQPTPAQRLTPRKHSLGVGGLSLFATGGCLMWTIVLIPLAIPLAIIGLAMAVWSLFVKTDPMQCPACGSANMVERTVTAGQCPHCGHAFKRTADGWERV